MNESIDQSGENTSQLLNNFRSGYIAVLGLPNVGKSTLLNNLLQHKLSIVSRKPQTTRQNILGILNGENYQIIFIDTPGILDPKYDLQAAMMKSVKAAIADADVLVYMVDISRKKQNDLELLKKFRPDKLPVLMALNKIDLIDRQQLLPFIEHYAQLNIFDVIVPISARNNDGTTQLIKEVVARMPAGPPYYPDDHVSNLQERFFVAEIIREKIFRFYSKEIPYATHVEIEEFKERQTGKDYIRAVIYLERSSQKSIVIGKKGQALKRVAQIARLDIERFLERPVFLELYVKVLEDWRRKETQLKRWGY